MEIDAVRDAYRLRTKHSVEDLKFHRVEIIANYHREVT